MSRLTYKYSSYESLDHYNWLAIIKFEYELYSFVH